MKKISIHDKITILSCEIDIAKSFKEYGKDISSSYISICYTYERKCYYVQY